MTVISLKDYQRAEREASITRAKIGPGVRSAVTVTVYAIVIVTHAVRR